MHSRPFKQVDVFTATPYLGNPVAVVLDGAGVSDEAMAAFARWTNLSETTFVLPPTPKGKAGGADYRLRIFTPGGELPFAGHPTLGSCHAWLEHRHTSGRAEAPQQRIVQECGVGLIQIECTADVGTLSVAGPPQGAKAPSGGSAVHAVTSVGAPQRLAFAAPPCTFSMPAPALLAQIATALGLKQEQVLAAQLLDNGPLWLGLLLDNPQTVLALRPDHAQIKHLGLKVGVASVNRSSNAMNSGATAQESQEPQLTVRAFAASIGINEDPVTGSLNASLAQWLIAQGIAPTSYVAAQGEAMGRAGRVHVAQDAGGTVWVGGESVTCINGTVQI